MPDSDSAVHNRLLVIDDDPGILDIIEEVASDAGYGVRGTSNAEEFRKLLTSFDPTLILVDLVIPSTDGIELLRELANARSAAQIVLMSGLDDKVLATAKRLGVNQGLNMLGVLGKPIDLKDLEDRLERAKKSSFNITKAALEAAITNGQIEPHYQPKVTLCADGTMPIEGAEALVRWNHPDQGVLSPFAFLATAEKTGLIGPMTDCVLDAAMSQLQKMDEAGLNISLAVNLAPQLLTDLKLPDKIVEQLSRIDVTNAKFSLEITESAAMEEGANTLDILTRFRVKQIGLSMDDFGTGYSSLVELYRMPFSELKIDKSFVVDIDVSEEAKIIVRSLVELARNLGLSTCAEGVETESALNYLRSVGCDKAQGYFISKPIPSDEFMAFVKNWNDGVNDTALAQTG